MSVVAVNSMVVVMMSQFKRTMMVMIPLLLMTMIIVMLTVRANGWIGLMSWVLNLPHQFCTAPDQ